MALIVAVFCLSLLGVSVQAAQRKKTTAYTWKSGKWELYYTDTPTYKNGRVVKDVMKYADGYKSTTTYTYKNSRKRANI